MSRKGCFITFEGGDGAGKTTLIDSLYHFLSRQGQTVLKTRAPGGTKVGDTLRSILLNRGDTPLSERSELFLFLADRAQHVEEIIVPALDKEQIVLCDRYNDSTVAYQGAARGFEEAWVRKLCDFATNGTNPDITIYLDIDPKVGLERVQRTGASKDRIESEALSFHTKIRDAFHKIAVQEPKRFHIIDASQTPDLVFKEAVKLIHGFIQ